MLEALEGIRLALPARGLKLNGALQHSEPRGQQENGHREEGSGDDPVVSLHWAEEALEV